MNGLNQRKRCFFHRIYVRRLNTWRRIQRGLQPVYIAFQRAARRDRPSFCVCTTVSSESSNSGKMCNSPTDWFSLKFATGAEFYSPTDGYYRYRQSNGSTALVSFVKATIVEIYSTRDAKLLLRILTRQRILHDLYNL